MSYIVSATYEEMSMDNGGMILTGETLITYRKYLSQCYFSTTNTTWTDTRMNPHLCDDTPALHTIILSCTQICAIL